MSVPILSPNDSHYVHLENDISSLLVQIKDTELVADELLKRWIEKPLSSEQGLIIANFLINAGFFPTLINKAIDLLKSNQPVPWAQLAEALGASLKGVDESLLKTLIDGARKQNLLHELTRSERLDSFCPDMIHLRSEDQQLRNKKLELKKKSLLERLDFLRHEGLNERAQSVLEDLIALFPNTPEYPTLLETLQKQWAGDIIENRAGHYWTSRSLRGPLPQELAQDPYVHALTQSAMEMAQKHSNLAYDLSIMMYTMDYYHEALRLLELSPKNPSTDWLKLELCLKSRRFVEVLQLCRQLEVTYANDPETSFASSYAAAQAYWELGESVQALQILRKLIEVRPQYASAQSLLREWSRERL